MAGENTLQFTDDNFETEVLGAETPVLVDFWAEWCGPCLMVAPTIDELANEYEGKIKVGKVDVDKSAKIAGQYNVQSIPTVILFDKGQPVERMVGAKNKREYKDILDARTGVS